SVGRYRRRVLRRRVAGGVCVAHRLSEGVVVDVRRIARGRRAARRLAAGIVAGEARALRLLVRVAATATALARIVAGEFERADEGVEPAWREQARQAGRRTGVDEHK